MIGNPYLYEAINLFFRQTPLNPQQIGGKIGAVMQSVGSASIRRVMAKSLKRNYPADDYPQLFDL
jgi:hypothetical protein